MNSSASELGKSAPRQSRSGPEPLLLCFSHLRWNFVYQRPQHLLSRAAASHRVIFFEEPVFDGSDAPRLDVRGAAGNVEVAVPVLPHGLSEAEAEDAQQSLLDDLLAGLPAPPHVLWYYTPMALLFSRHVEAAVCVYDCMDELSAFRGASPRMVALEGELLSRADLVFTGGRSLYEAKRPRHPRVHAFPSSIDAAHFGRARDSDGPEPDDQAALPRPRLGFFGVIDERMDLGILAGMADLRPSWQFVMIGPVVKLDEADLPRRPNLHWLGGRSYDALPSYLQGWDVGLVPFAMNESTRFISPTKTPEFLAAGVPVVSTPVPDVVSDYGAAGLVEIARDAGEMVARAEVLMARPKEPWLERVDRRLAPLSWDRTWSGMRAAIEERLRERRRADAPANPAAREGARV